MDLNKSMISANRFPAKDAVILRFMVHGSVNFIRTNKGGISTMQISIY